MDTVMKKLKLKHKCGSLDFHVFKIYPDEAVIEFQVSCTFEPKPEMHIPKEFNATFYGDDLERLASYFDRQRQSLLDTDEISYAPFITYLTYGMEFQFEVRGGDDVYSVDDGYITLLVLINSDPTAKHCNRYWIGFESDVRITDLDEFCEELREINHTYRVIEGGEGCG